MVKFNMEYECYDGCGRDGVRGAPLDQEEPQCA